VTTLIQNPLKPPTEPTESALSEAASGTDSASGNGLMFASLYSELRRLAERQLRGNAGVPISPTTLLHEAYLGMAGGNAVFPDRAHFLGYAARVMRGLIIDFVRERRAQKRGSGFNITELPAEIAQVDDAQLTRLSELLDELSNHDSRLAEVVDLRYFCGFTIKDIAAQRGSSERTVERDWEKARAILFHELKHHP
jgi:RNA polymerase sigma factor (TIGR02999 family)